MMLRQVESDEITRADDTTAYTAGDVIAHAAAVATLKFNLAAQFLRIRSALLVDSANVATKLEADLLLFSEDQADVDAENAPYTPTDAQMLTCVGRVAFLAANGIAGDVTAAAGGNAINQVSGLDVVVHAPARRLYGVLVARNGYVPVALEKFKVRLGVEYES